jgi:hypothetical protein
VISGTPTIDSAANTYTVIAGNAAGNNSATISITVVSPPASTETALAVNFASPNQPVVHTALSPNGDGKNDVLTIDNIANFPKNTFKVMNASGTKVYEATGYDNVTKPFDGHSSLNGALMAALKAAGN